MTVHRGPVPGTPHRAGVWTRRTVGTVVAVTDRHLVWDWNGTLLDDLTLIVEATNAAFAAVGGPRLDADFHRRHFRRPITEYYAQVLGRPVDDEEFALINTVFHEAYRKALTGCPLAPDATDALRSWPGNQSLLSMWYHRDLVPTVRRYGLHPHFRRIDGLRVRPGGFAHHKEPFLRRHLAAQRVEPRQAVVVGDSVDDAVAARSVGAACVLYSGGFTHPDVLAATGAPVVDTLQEAVELARSL